MSEIEIGDVVQIDPEHDPTFGGHFLVVTEVKSWGVQGYVTPLPVNRGEPRGLAYYRIEFDKIARIGKAEWWKP